MRSRRTLFLTLALALALMALAACATGTTTNPPAAATSAPAVQPAATSAAAPTTAPAAGGGVTLTMGSWRSDDTKQMNAILDKFHEAHPNITIKFDPSLPNEYNTSLRTQLETGKGPDLFYLRSFATSRDLFQQGFLEPLDDVKGLKDNFTDQYREPWATDDGKSYGIPFIAVSHGIYYNKDLFAKLGIQPPATWEELIADAKKIQDSGVTPFANASGDAWTIAEIVFMNLAPNFIGGREGRLAYLSGDRCFNDANTVAAFQAIKDLAPYLPKGQEGLKYYDSQQLFLQGKAAMWLGGSWDIPFFETEKPDFQWGVFATPPPAGKPEFVTFHLDAGMGLNSKSTHKAEAKEFLSWMTTPEFAKLMADQLPGFFPMSNNPPAVADPYAQAFLDFNKGHGTDVRWAWPVLLEKQPDGYTLMQDGAIAVIGGSKTPQQAADDLQNGLAQWLPAAKNCKK